MNWLDFNMNDTVRVQLTDQGRKVHRQNFDELRAAHPRITDKDYPYRPPKEDKDGWSEWQLWCLFQEFGEHIHNGCTVPFKTSIKLSIHSQGTK